MGYFSATVTLAVLLQLFAATSVAKTEKRQLKDVQLKIPLQIRARRYCTDADCVETCPIDYDLDSRKQYCRYKRASCPSSYVLRHGSCVLREVQCPPGSIRQANRCVVKSLECPPGYVLEGNSCVNSKYCPAGYHWENGFCYQQQRAQICPHGYESRNGICIQICVNCEAACAECDEETVPLKCPSGYEPFRGRCLKILQGRADVVLRNVTYKVPMECKNDETYHDGSCVSWRFDDVRCSFGHFYNQRCVEVARCSRGLLQNNCECLVENKTPAVCRHGQPGAAGCVVGKAQCKKLAQLSNESCVRKVDSHKPICARGTPLSDIYCNVGTPSCPTGFTLVDTFCKKNHSLLADCGRNELQEGWCISQAKCESGYKWDKNGACVLERTQPSNSDESRSIFCGHEYQYDDRYGICVKCTEKRDVCDESAGYSLVDNACVRYEPLCPVDYVWTGSYCFRKPYKECSVGYLFEDYCIHSHLSCTEDYDLLEGVCVKRGASLCPEGSISQNGLCITAHLCPEGYTSGSTCCMEETHFTLNNTVKPNCIPGYHFDDGNCVKIIWRNVTVETRLLQCPKGYTLRNGKCVAELYGLLACPPKTILMNQDNRCFCKVDLICPTGYERMGDECIFRSANYFSSFLNFLNPCYGVQCGLQYCLTQCFSPPCPVQLCSFGSIQHSSAMYANHYNPPGQEPCGIGEACIANVKHESSVGLICPPGYNRENSTCVAYYDRICQSGFKMSSGRCIKTDEVNGLCPLGFTQSLQTCIRTQCEAGYTLDGASCKKVDYKAPIPCSKNYILLNGLCIHRSECVGGSIEGDTCVRRQYASYRCLPGFLLYNESCVMQDNSCPFTESAALECPPGTRRVKNMCVYPKAPISKNGDIQSSKCTGMIHRGDLCAYIKTPTCTKGYVLREGKCISCSSKPPECPYDMVIVDGQCLKYVPNDLVPPSVKPATCPQGYLFEGKCLHDIPACRVGYVLDENICMLNDIVPATCSNGVIMNGRCVEMIKCDGPNYTLKNRTCVSIECSEPTCNGKTTRVQDICINGSPKCPDNHCILNGYCYSSLLKPAECSGNGKCLDNFCHLSNPTCSASFDFDGSVCKKTVVGTPNCPEGTKPDRTDRSYCLYSSEQADFFCSSEYYYKNGICQKQQYAEATCPNGFRRKADVCVRKSCTSAALTTFCGTSGLTQSVGTGNSIALPAFSNHSTVSKPQQSDTCCIVFSPRMCRFDDRSSEWNCAHTKHNLCGSFCEYRDQQIYLRTATSYNIDDVLMLVPPEESETSDTDNNGHSDEDDDYSYDSGPDCEPCTDLSYDCSSYCYTFDCQRNPGGCVFMDQEVFCRKHPGPACSARDGCVDKRFCMN